MKEFKARTMELHNVPGVSESVFKELQRHGFKTVGDVLTAPEEDVYAAGVLSDERFHQVEKYYIRITEPDERELIDTDSRNGLENPYTVTEDGTVLLSENFAGEQVRIRPVKDN